MMVLSVWGSQLIGYDIKTGVSKIVVPLSDGTIQTLFGVTAGVGVSTWIGTYLWKRSIGDRGRPGTSGSNPNFCLILILCFLPIATVFGLLSLSVGGVATGYMVMFTMLWGSATIVATMLLWGSQALNPKPQMPPAVEMRKTKPSPRKTPPKWCKGNKVRLPNGRTATVEGMSKSNAGEVKMHYDDNGEVFSTLPKNLTRVPKADKRRRLILQRLPRDLRAVVKAMNQPEAA